MGCSLSNLEMQVISPLILLSSVSPDCSRNGKQFREKLYPTPHCPREDVLQTHCFRKKKKKNVARKSPENFLGKVLAERDQEAYAKCEFLYSAV